MIIEKKSVSCRLQSIDGARLIASLLSNLIYNFDEECYDKMNAITKNQKRVEVNTKIANAVLNIQPLKMI